MFFRPPAARRRRIPSEISCRNAIASRAASTASVSVLTPKAAKRLVFAARRFVLQCAPVVLAVRDRLTTYHGKNAMFLVALMIRGVVETDRRSNKERACQISIVRQPPKHARWRQIALDASPTAPLEKPKGP